MALTISNLKRQLNIELSYDDDNAVLQQMLDVSVIAVNNFCNVNILTGYTDAVTGYTIDATDLPLPILQATIMLAAHFFLNRNMVSFGQGTEIPYTFQFLLSPYKNFILL